MNINVICDNNIIRNDEYDLEINGVLCIAGTDVYRNEVEKMLSYF